MHEKNKENYFFAFFLFAVVVVFLFTVFLLAAGFFAAVLFTVRFTAFLGAALLTVLRFVVAFFLTAINSISYIDENSKVKGYFKWRLSVLQSKQRPCQSMYQIDESDSDENDFIRQ